MASTYSHAFQCLIITFKDWWAASHCELCARSRECLSPGFHRNLVRWKCARQWTVYWWFWDSHAIRQKFICYREKPWRWSVLVCEQKLVQYCYHTRHALHAQHWDAVLLRPFYSPWEFPQLFFTVVYIHPRANVSKTADILSQSIHRLDSLSPDAPRFILGDFKPFKMGKTCKNFH